MFSDNSERGIARFCIKTFGRDIDCADQLAEKDDRDLFHRVCLGSIRVNDDGDIIEKAPRKARTDAPAGEKRIDLDKRESFEPPTGKKALTDAARVRAMGHASPVMPSFRGLPSVPPKQARKPEHTELMIELQIVDLWWLHAHYRDAYACLGTGGSSLTDLLAALCSKSEFDEALAREIAERGVRGSTKHGELDVFPSHQFELCQLRSGDVRERQKTLRNRRDAVHRHLLSLAPRNSKVRGNEADWALAYIAGELSDDMAEADEGSRPKKTSQTDANRIYRKLGGKQIAASSFGGKLKSARLHVLEKASSERLKRIIEGAPKQQKSSSKGRETQKSA